LKKTLSIIIIVLFLAGIAVSMLHAEDGSPTNLTAKSKGKGIFISWSKVSGNDYGYYVLRTETPGSGHEVVQFISSPDITTYQDNELKRGNKYGYMIQNAEKSGKRGAKSNEAVAVAGRQSSYENSGGETEKPTKKPKKTTTTTAKKGVPEVPTKIKARQTENSVLLSWKASKNADGYYIHRSSNAADEDFKQIGEAKDETTFEDTELNKSASYFYYVVAFNNKGQSDRSELASIGESEETLSLSKVSKKNVFLGFEGFRDNSYSVNEAVCVRLDDKSVWIGHADNNLPNYPPMVNTGTLPTFPEKDDSAILGFGINKALRFMFYYQPDKTGNIYQSASKFQNSWAEWTNLGELPPPTGYKKGKFKFAFGVSPTWFCCVALDTQSMQAYEAVCQADGRSWSPWKSIGRIDAPRFVKGDYFMGLAYDDKMYYLVMMQPETNGFISNVYNGTAWGGWKEGAQRPQYPEWLTR